MAYGRGCYGGGCYGGGYGWGGCYGGGWGGCYGGGYGCGGGYGRGQAWGGGYGGYAWGGMAPWGGYAYTPMTTYGSTITTPMMASNPFNSNLGMNQSFFFNPGANPGSEARIIVHLPANATLTIDGEATQSRSSTRMFVSPPLQQGKTYTYTLRGELNRDGHKVNARHTVEVQAGRTAEVTLNFPDTGPRGQGDSSNSSDER